MVQPGDSAVIALLRTANPAIVADQFRGYGGTILSTTLNRDQEQKVNKVLSKKAALVPSALVGELLNTRQDPKHEHTQCGDQSLRR
jgi:hypothetical protein